MFLQFVIRFFLNAKRLRKAPHLRAPRHWPPGVRRSPPLGRRTAQAPARSPPADAASGVGTVARHLRSHHRWESQGPCILTIDGEVSRQRPDRQISVSSSLLGLKDGRSRASGRTAAGVKTGPLGKDRGQVAVKGRA